MNKTINFLLLSLALITMSFAQTAVRFPSQDFTQENFISSVVRTSNNHILLFWFNNDSKKLFMSRSTDNGNTWSDRQQILSGYTFLPDTVFELNSITDNNSNIILEFKLNQGLKHHLYSISTNNGINWTSPVNLNFTSGLNNTRAFNSSLGKLSNGTVVFCYNFRSANQPNPKGIYISRLVNNNWTTNQIIDSNGTWGFVFSPATNKEMVVFADSNGNKTDLYFRTSTDLGNTWSARQILLSTPNSKSRPRVIKNNNGEIYIFYEELLPTSFNNFYQRDISYIKSTNEGTTWSSPVRVTNFVGEDKFLSVTSSVANTPILTFISSRNYQLGNNKNQVYLLNQPETVSPPALIYSPRLPDTVSYGSSLNVSAFVDDYTQIESVHLLVSKINRTDTVQMYDDGLHQDSLAGDRIYGATISNLFNGAYYFYVSIKNVNQFTNTFSIGRVIVPIQNAYNSYMMELNKIKLPMNRVGVLADVNVNGISGMRYEDKEIVYSGGFFLAGKKQNQWWANGVASASRIQDYLPGLPGFLDDPLNILYIVKSSDPPFSSSWQNWSNAVLLGADFYDGNNDGIYTPIDLNQNGQWDINEDKPDLLGDITVWCTYNDSKPPIQRRFNNIEPQGIQIKQTVFGVKPNNLHQADNVVFVRYRIVNNGSVSNEFDSVYFSIWSDPDIGSVNNAYWDDLVAYDSLLQSGYAYNDGDDPDWGINPPAIANTLLQGPVKYIPGVTFIDNNSNGVYDPGIDIPLDTAYVRNGSLMGIQQFPGAKNLLITSFSHFIAAHHSQGDPNLAEELINYMLGFNRLRNLIDPCVWEFGTVIGVNCNLVNPLFMYSGNPFTNYGWINNFPTDQRILTSVGPFNLKANQPVDIWVAYVVGRGTNALNSISVMRDNINYAINAYKNNFTTLPVKVEDDQIIVNEFKLYQNYPNPFNPSTTISWQLPVSGRVTIKLFDILGREIDTIVDGYYEAGKHSTFYILNSTLSSGVYFYRLQAGNYIETKKMMLLK